jgi:DNA-directed RNA polymerase specialized sigma24 family protein
MTEQEQDAYELFRRAIIERDEDAWKDIHTRYRAMLAGWALRAGLRDDSAERAEDIADRAFARAWLALSPERFAEFPSLATLLSYLRSCVATTVIDGVRAQVSFERVSRRYRISQTVTPENAVLASLDSSALWRLVLALSSTQAERIVLVESFNNGRPPRLIQSLHPQLFPDVMSVYSVKRNLFARLQRNQDLQRLCRDFIAIE